MNSLLTVVFGVLVVLPTAYSTTVNIGAFTYMSANNQTENWQGSSVMASYLLAAHHFNNRLTTIVDVPSIAGVAGCAVNISVTPMDTGGSPSLAIKQYLDKGASNAFNAIVGPARSAVSGPMAILTGLQNVLQVSHWSTSPGLDDTSAYPSFMRTIPSDASTTVAMMDYVKDQGWPHIACLYVNDDYGTKYMQAAVSNGAKNNITVHAFGFTNGDKVSAEKAVEKIANLKLRIILCIFFDNDAENVLLKAQSLGMVGEENFWLYTDGVQNFQAEKIKTLFDGAVQILSRGMVVEVAESQKLLTALKGYSPTWNGYLASGFVPKGCCATDKDWSESGSDKVADISAYAFDAMIAIGVASCNLVASNLPITGSNLYTKMKTLDFPGASGQVLFDQYGSRDSKTVNYRASNAVLKADNTLEMKENIGQWTGAEGWKFPTTSIVFSGGKTTAPAYMTLPKHEMNQLTAGVRTFAFFLFAVNVIASLGFIVWTFINRKKKIIKASQPIFLYCIAIGCIISSAAIIPSGFDDASGLTGIDTACMASPWMYSIGFTLTFSALFAKSHRVRKIFTNTSFQIVNISESELFGYIGALMFIDGIILLIWTVVNPMKYIRTVLTSDTFGNPTSSVGLCQAVDGSVPLEYILPIGILHLCVLVYGSYICYQIKDVAGAFSEAKYISVSMFGSLQVLLVGVPVMVMVNSQPWTSFLIRSSIIFLNDFSVLCFIFVPKVWMFYSPNRDSYLRTDTVSKTVTSSSNVDPPKRPTAKTTGKTASDAEKTSEIRISGGGAVVTDV